MEKWLKVFKEFQIETTDGEVINFDNNFLDELVIDYNTRITKDVTDLAPLVLGHPDPYFESSAPAYGWIKSLKRTENFLEALVEFGTEAVNWIKEKKYTRMSISFDYKAKRFLHLGLLGAHYPRIKNLQPLEFSEGKYNVAEKLNKEKTMNFIFDDELQLEFTNKKEKTNMNLEEQFAETKSELKLLQNELKIAKEQLAKFSESETIYKDTITNITHEKEVLQNSLNDKENELKNLNNKIAKSEIENFVNDLITSGKINANDKENLTNELFVLKNSEVKFSDDVTMFEYRKQTLNNSKQAPVLTEIAVSGSTNENHNFNFNDLNDYEMNLKLSEAAEKLAVKENISYESAINKLLKG